MRALVTPTFARASKKLHPSQKQELDQAIRALMLDPMLGEAKVGEFINFVWASSFVFSPIVPLTPIQYDC